MLVRFFAALGEFFLLSLFEHLELIFEVVLQGNGGTSHLLELLEFQVDVLLNLVPLDQFHLALSDVVDGLIIVVHQVSIDEWAVAHVDLLVDRFGALAEDGVCQSGRILRFLEEGLGLVIGLAAAEVVPVAVLGRVDHISGVELTERVS
jgi:hypothetical protein